MNLDLLNKLINDAGVALSQANAALVAIQRLHDADASAAVGAGANPTPPPVGSPPLDAGGMAPAPETPVVHVDPPSGSLDDVIARVQAQLPAVVLALRAINMSNNGGAVEHVVGDVMLAHGFSSGDVQMVLNAGAGGSSQALVDPNWGKALAAKHPGLTAQQALQAEFSDTPFAGLF